MQKSSLDLAVVVFGFSVVCLRAQSDLPATNNTAPMAIVGTRLPSLADETATSVTVITREQMDREQQRLVAEVLRGEPGVDVARTGQPGGLTSVFLRGANNSHTLVLIDGVRVNNGFNNAFDFNNLPIENIERIEILRGPQSTLYGSEALGGVINIITRRGAQNVSGSLTAEYGSYDTWLTRGSVALTEGRFSLTAEGGHAAGDNDRLNSAYDNWNFSGRTTFTASEHFSASFLANYFYSRAGSPNDRFTDDPNDYLKNENKLFALTLDASPLRWWQSKLTLSHANERGYFNQPAPNPPFALPDYSSELFARRSQADFQNIFLPAEGHRVLAGGTYERSDADYTDPFSGVDRSVTTRSLYAQYEFTPWSRLSLNLGGRLDDSSSFGSFWTYRGGARFTVPGAETILRGNAGTGFRAPSISQLYYPFFGNPNLVPEESLGWDIGFEHPLAGDALRIGATWFHNDFDNLINGFPPANVARAQTRGIESSLTWTPVTNLTLRATYTWLDSEDRATGLRLIRRPEHRGSLGANWQVCESLSAFVNALFTGRRADDDFSSFPSTRVGLPAYTKLDLGFNVRICRGFNVYGRVENLLDEHYEEVFGFPALGRFFAVGGTARF